MLAGALDQYEQRQEWKQIFQAAILHAVTPRQKCLAGELLRLVHLTNSDTRFDVRYDVVPRSYGKIWGTWRQRDSPYQYDANDVVQSEILEAIEQHNFVISGGFVYHLEDWPRQLAEPP